MIEWEDEATFGILDQRLVGLGRLSIRTGMVAIVAMLEEVFFSVVCVTGSGDPHRINARQVSVNVISDFAFEVT